MKEDINLKSIIAGLVVLIIGILWAIADLNYFHWPSSWGLSVGCSLIASALVILLTALFVEKRKHSALDEWKIDKIYSTRAEKNLDSDLQLDKAKYCVDAIAFGLSSFRSSHDKRVETCLRNGVDFRIITMDPNSDFVIQRAIEENQVDNQIKNTIESLVAWADKKNSKNYKGKIIIKGYNAMTLDFYWRVDNDLYVGPYWYGVDSQQTITYKFNEGGKGFLQYTEYFEKLWENETLCHVLTKESKIKTKKKDRSK